nr:hypothetical protein [Tanacetum cinerariifolium]
RVVATNGATLESLDTEPAPATFGPSETATAQTVEKGTREKCFEEIKSTFVESACGKRVSYGGGWSYDQATVGYTPMHEKVKIPCGHLYDQDQPVGSQSASKVYTKMKKNPEGS